MQHPRTFVALKLSGFIPVQQVINANLTTTFQILPPFSTIPLDIYQARAAASDRVL